MVELPRNEVFETTAEADMKVRDVPATPPSTSPMQQQATTRPKSKVGTKLVLIAALLAGELFALIDRKDVPWLEANAA